MVQPVIGVVGMARFAQRKDESACTFVVIGLGACESLAILTIVRVVAPAGLAVAATPEVSCR
jgi:hypothetical protein